MGKETGIAWTTSTFNPWIGCTKVGPGCDHCYAEADAKARHRVKWGLGAVRRRTTSAWVEVRRWNREAARNPKPWWVFAASLADFLDNEVPAEWRTDFLALVAECRALRWQLLTKRISLVGKFVPPGWFRDNPHVGLMVTVVNQEEAERDIPRLIELKREFGIKWISLSIEPQLECIELQDAWLQDLDWVIVGGESGPDARPLDLAWARSLIAQCTRADVPVFMKQVGRNAWNGGKQFMTRHWAGGKPEEWPTELRIRQMPRVYDRTV